MEETMTAQELASLVPEDACAALIISENPMEAGDLGYAVAYAFMLGGGYEKMAFAAPVVGCVMGNYYALTPTTVPKKFLRSVQEAYAEELLQVLLRMVRIEQERAPSRDSKILAILFPSETGHRVLESLDGLFRWSFLEGVIDGIVDTEHSCKVADAFAERLAQEITCRGGTLHLPNDLAIAYRGDRFVAYQKVTP